VINSKRGRILSPAISAVLCLLAMSQDQGARVAFWGAWALIGLVFLYQDRRRPEPDRFDQETAVRGSRRGALFFGLGSVVFFGLATLQPEHPTGAFVSGAVFAVVAGAFLWLASFWTTSRGQLRLERLRQQDALKKGSPTPTVTAATSAPAGQAGTAWPEPPYFSSN
jgi:hypothetical protein